MTQEALKLALEALEVEQTHVEIFRLVPKPHLTKTITAIKEALAKEKILQALHDENERLGLYKEAYAQLEPLEKFCDSNCVWTDHHPDCKLAQPEQLHASEDVSIGVDVTEEGAHVIALRSYRNGAKVVFYSQFHSAPQRTEQEPVKIAHRHEWFRTGEMKVGQMRCISCGTWGHEEMPQRTWVGLTTADQKEIQRQSVYVEGAIRMTEAKLKERNG